MYTQSQRFCHDPLVLNALSYPFCVYPATCLRYFPRELYLYECSLAFTLDSAVYLGYLSLRNVRASPPGVFALAITSDYSQSPGGRMPFDAGNLLA
jgi:hypothetical protein